MLEFWLKDKENNINMRLPVSPKSFEVMYGRRIETVNITNGGDLNIYAGKNLDTIKVESFFPNGKYPFSIDNKTKKDKPYDLIAILKKWIQDKQILQYVIPTTKISKYVIIENVTYGEKDGTGDVYYTLTLREYRQLKEFVTATKKKSSTQGTKRVDSDVDSKKGNNKSKKYIVKKGDTLSSISLKFYGKSSGYTKIYNANKNLIKNPNIIKIGWELIIP